MSEDDAIAAWHATEDLFDSIEEAASYARKRHGSALLWRLDGSETAVERMLDRLRQGGRFVKVLEISEDKFWAARSYGV